MCRLQRSKLTGKVFAAQPIPVSLLLFLSFPSAAASAINELLGRYVRLCRRQQQDCPGQYNLVLP